MPPSTLRDICFDCADQYRVARFWAEVLGYTMHAAEGQGADEPVALAPEGGGLRIWFSPVPEPKTVKNRVHIDINMPGDAEMDPPARARGTAVGEIRSDDGALWWTIMADLEGIDFCAFPPRM